MALPIIPLLLGGLSTGAFGPTAYSIYNSLTNNKNKTAEVPNKLETLEENPATIENFSTLADQRKEDAKAAKAGEQIDLRSGEIVPPKSDEAIYAAAAASDLPDKQKALSDEALAKDFALAAEGNITPQEVAKTTFPQMTTNSVDKYDDLRNMVQQMEMTTILAKRVIRGELGNGKERVENILRLGGDPKAVQALVNQMMRNSPSPKKKKPAEARSVLI